MIAEDGEVQTSPKGSFSFPYGAAALTRRLSEVSESKLPEIGRKQLAEEIKASFEQAYRDLELPPRLQDRAKRRGLTLHLSGGGFRGWGYLLMSQHKNTPYPIPIINGFQVSVSDFQNTVNVQEIAATQEIFRVSKRRAAQVPSVAFLISALIEALPVIEEIRFCQGGVREGFLYDLLEKPTQAMDPLPSASAALGGPSAAEIADLLTDAVPGPNDLDRFVSESLTRALLRAVADTMFIHSSFSKESTSLSALYTTITGPLASAHGVSHTDRALLALMLCRRWDGDLAPPHDSLQARLRQLLTPQEVFWCNYIGTIAKLIGDVYPAGKIVEKRLGFAAKWSEGLGKKGLAQGVALTIHARQDDPMTLPAVLREAIERTEAVGKKKNKIGGRDGFGVPIEVSVERDL